MPPEAHAQAAGKQAQSVHDLITQAQVKAALDGLAQSVGDYTAATVAAEQEAARRAALPVDWTRWERLHRCEQPDTWYANGTNPAEPDGMVFQGGLGMSTGAWRMARSAAAARGVPLPASALAATPEEQMTGAQAFFDAYGWAWGCHV